MDNKVDSFFKSIKNKTVAFIGIGVSHIDTIKLFASKVIDSSACDRREESSFGDGIIEDIKKSGAKVVLGDFQIANLGADIVFRTPGMYYYQPELTEFKKNGGIVTSEMEVFFSLCPAKTVAVTGSDGKTTTTTLIAEMLKAQGYKVHLGGNIGRALLPIIEEISPEDYAVVELSSFQLISMRPAPNIAVVTNLTPNHLDVHSSMEEYIESKRNILSHQDGFSKTILNLDDQVSKDFIKDVRGELSFFSLEKPVTKGAYLNNEGYLIYSNYGKEDKLFHSDEIALPGIHNIANYLTAISAVYELVDNQHIYNVAKSFTGVEHRIELVRQLNGVKWYNDSIASSPNRTIAGLRSFNKKVILLAGGKDKNISYDPLAPEIIQNVKLLLLAGPTADTIYNAVTSHPSYNPNDLPIIMCKDIPHMVEVAYEKAKQEDIVILSPASTSFDAYQNFEERGKHFKKLVNNLE